MEQTDLKMKFFVNETLLRHVLDPRHVGWDSVWRIWAMIQFKKWKTEGEKTMHKPAISPCLEDKPPEATVMSFDKWHGHVKEIYSAKSGFDWLTGVQSADRLKLT